MEIEMLSDEKNSAEFKIDNSSVAEVLRVYLNKVEGVRLAAWKREHPSKPLMFKIECEGKTVRKAVSEAVLAIKKELGTFEKTAKKK